MSFGAKFWLRLDADQMDRIDEFVTNRRFKTKTAAIRHLIERGLERASTQRSKTKRVGVLSVLYDCGHEGVAGELAGIEIESAECILSSNRLCVESRYCLNVLALMAPPDSISALWTG